MADRCLLAAAVATASSPRLTECIEQRRGVVGTGRLEQPHCSRRPLHGPVQFEFLAFDSNVVTRLSDVPKVSGAWVRVVDLRVDRKKDPKMLRKVRRSFL